MALIVGCESERGGAVLQGFQPLQGCWGFSGDFPSEGVAMAELRIDMSDTSQSLSGLWAASSRQHIQLPRSRNFL